MSASTESTMNKAKTRLAAAFARLERLAGEAAKSRKTIAGLEKELEANKKIRDEMARELHEAGENASRLESALFTVTERLESAIARVDSLMEEEHGKAHG